MEFESLHRFCDKIGLRYVEANFVLSQSLAMIFSFFFRAYFGPSKASAKTRYSVLAVFGVLICIQAIGWQILHLLLVSTVCYVLVNSMSPRIMQWYVSAFAILYLSFIHVKQMVFGKGVNNFDAVGPLMVLTMKVSCLAWSLHDGLARKESDLNELQRKMVIRQMPSLLEYVSFIFYPQSILIGPVLYYSDYSDFIQGNSFKVREKNSDGKEVIIYREPSAAIAITKKLILALICALGLLFLIPRFPIKANVDEEHLANSSFWYKTFFMLVSVEFGKFKYFFGWVWADAINNAAGMGFNGYDEKGNPKWDAISQVDLWHFQFATSLKVLIDSWNKSALKWLRHTCFDRVTFQPGLVTIILSSMWHGFFPGYIITFLSAFLMLTAAKKMRSNFRHLFQKSAESRAVYDVITWAATYVSLAYVITPFTYLRLDLSIKFFNSMYWWLHIVAVVILLFLPSRKRSTTKAGGNNTMQEKANGASKEVKCQELRDEEVKKDL